MDGPPDERAPNLDDVAARLCELERRVARLELERQSEAVPEAAVWPRPIEAAPRPLQHVVPDGTADAVPSVPGGVIPVLGRALLGIAGAYLLRAIAESGAIPQLAAVLAGFVYAGWWLFSSSRVASGSRFTTAVYGLTAALVISPMLWETTVRFQVLSPLVTATVLVFFVVLGAALAWPRNLAVITWITTLAGVVTAVALIVATRAVVPFTVALLVMAVVVEYAACRDHWLSERWIVALTTDFSVFLVTYLVTRPNGVPEGYAPIPVALAIGIQIALLSIYLGSTVYRTLIHGLSITSFEIGQAVVAFLISIGGALEVARRATAASASVGVFCVVSGAACYLVAFSFLEHKEGRRRNLYTYSSFGLALILTACYILSSGVALATICSLLTLAAMWTGERFKRTSLRMHAAAYLLVAAIVSGLMGFGYDRIIGSAAQWPSPDAGVLIVAVAAACSYALNRSTAGPATRVPAFVIGALLCWSAIALVTGAIAPLEPGILAALRTATICVLAIFLAWAGPRWNRQELIWLLYPLIALGALKLVAEDFRQGRAVTLCLSLLFYGGALVLVPRLVRNGRKPA